MDFRADPVRVSLGKRARVAATRERRSYMPPETWYEPAAEAPGVYTVVEQPAGAGYRHILSEEDIRARLAELPNWMVQPLQVVQISQMTVQEASCSLLWHAMGCGDLSLPRGRYVGRGIWPTAIAQPTHRSPDVCAEWSPRPRNAAGVSCGAKALSAIFISTTCSFTSSAIFSTSEIAIRSIGNPPRRIGRARIWL